MQARTLVVVVATALAITDGHAQELVGVASVVDGDTIEIHGQRIRIFGIDAPEGTQTCKGAKGEDYRCGQRAARALDTLAGGRVVVCNQRDTDRYERPVAVCRAGSVDLGTWMVDHGLAVVFVRYSDLYAASEKAARAKHIGLWAGTFEMPSDYRERMRHENAQSAPNPKCAIKGNVNRKGARLYHMPGSREYDATRIDPDNGERWFCSEAEAQTAGWHRAD